MSQFAARTSVPVAQTKMEIEKVLAKYGADQFAVFVDSTDPKAAIQFRLAKKQIRFEMSLRDLRDQQVKQRWRALLLAIKSKLESVESGIESFEEAFLAHVVMPNGGTFGRLAIPQIEQAVKDGKMPTTLMITDQRPA